MVEERLISTRCGDRLTENDRADPVLSRYLTLMGSESQYSPSRDMSVLKPEIEHWAAGVIGESFAGGTILFKWPEFHANFFWVAFSSTVTRDPFLDTTSWYEWFILEAKLSAWRRFFVSTVSLCLKSIAIAPRRLSSVSFPSWFFCWLRSRTTVEIGVSVLSLVSSCGFLSQ